MESGFESDASYVLSTRSVSVHESEAIQGLLAIRAKTDQVALLTEAETDQDALPLTESETDQSALSYSSMVTVWKLPGAKPNRQRQHDGAKDTICPGLLAGEDDMLRGNTTAQRYKVTIRLYFKMREDKAVYGRSKTESTMRWCSANAEFTMPNTFMLSHVGKFDKHLKKYTTKDLESGKPGVTSHARMPIRITRYAIDSSNIGKIKDAAQRAIRSVGGEGNVAWTHYRHKNKEGTKPNQVLGLIRAEDVSGCESALASDAPASEDQYSEA